MLLGGYLYADRLSLPAPAAPSADPHGAGAAGLLLMLPVMPDAAWKPVAADDPSLRILALLAATIGLPLRHAQHHRALVQSWFAFAPR